MSERDLLTGFLDWYRAVVERKVADLSVDDATRVMTPTGLSPLGIVKHLGDVERRWFCLRFAGEDVAILRADDDPDADFRIEPDDTIASVVDSYRAAVADARRITEGASLDDRPPPRPRHQWCDRTTFAAGIRGRPTRASAWLPAP